MDTAADLLAGLKKRLEFQNREIVSGYKVDLRPLEETTKAIHAWGAGRTSDKPDEELIKRALRIFYAENRVLPQFLPYGMGKQFEGKRLIQNPDDVMTVLREIDATHARHFLYLMGYRALLAAYFQFDPCSPEVGEIELKNWEAIRKYLWGSLHKLRHGEPSSPPWTGVLARHKNLLSGNPCQDYAEAALRGDRSSFNEAKDTFFSDADWPTRNLISAQIDRVCSSEDDVFRNYVTPLTKLIEENQYFANDGLTQLLNRYAECESQPVNTPLAQFVVRYWGQPWLTSKRQNWLCQPDAKKMIERWLRRHLLCQFFACLSESDHANPRRLAFWDLYSDEENVSFFFALGANAFDKKDGDFQTFRKDAAGLFCRLEGASRANNAFILQFPNFDVIEFSEHGNATYFYDKRKGALPYRLDQGYVHIGSERLGEAGLKAGGNNPPFSEPLRHQDTNDGAWEKKFARKMGATPTALVRFCETYSCKHIVGQRGGYEWVMRDAAQRGCTKQQWDVLLGWDFEWDEKRNGYRREVKS